jgi:hypothetical protein
VNLNERVHRVELPVSQAPGPAGVVTGRAAPALPPPDSYCAGRRLCPGKRLLSPTSTRGTAIALEGSTVPSGNLSLRRKG